MANLCVAIASSKSDSTVVSACAREGHVIFFFPKKPSEAQQEVRKRSLRGRFGVKFCRFSLRRGREMVQVEPWGNSLPFHRTLRRRVWSPCYSAVAET